MNRAISEEDIIAVHNYYGVDMRFLNSCPPCLTWEQIERVFESLGDSLYYSALEDIKQALKDQMEAE